MTTPFIPNISYFEGKPEIYSIHRIRSILINSFVNITFYISPIRREKFIYIIKNVYNMIQPNNNKDKEIELGSVCSGGSYAKLISRFRGVDVPGTGISFGVDRLLFALMQLDQIKVEDQKPVLVCVMDQKYLKNYYKIVDLLRENNINAEVFLSTKKNLGKQLDLANKRELDVAIICGENEFKDNTVTIKNLKGTKGENSQTVPKSNLINEVKKLI